MGPLELHMEMFEAIVSGRSRPKYLIVDNDQEGLWTSVVFKGSLLEYYDMVASFPQFGTETNAVSRYLLRYFYSDMYGAPEGTQLLF